MASASAAISADERTVSGAPKSSAGADVVEDFFTHTRPNVIKNNIMHEIEDH